MTEPTQTPHWRQPVKADTGPAAPTPPAIKPGQEWEEIDPRGGRRVKVIAATFGAVQSVTVTTLGKYPQTFAVNRSHFGSPNGYRLVKDAT
jgi:hypothetical protein